MKQQLVEWARNILRLMPIPLGFRRSLQGFCFSTFPSLFHHLPAYQLWSLQNPDIAAKKLRKTNLPQERTEVLEKGHYNTKAPSILMVSHSLGGWPAGSPAAISEDHSNCSK